MAPHRPFWQALIFERDGDLNLGQMLNFFIALVGMIGFLYINIFCETTTVFEKIASWSFLGAAFAATLIAAVPLAKAKILANAKLPGEVARGISEALHYTETSTDLMEISHKQTPDKG